MQRFNDRDVTNQSKDLLQGIGGPITKANTKRMKQALRGLIIKIKGKKDRLGLEATPKWVTFL